jgi:hypothetical protein
MVCVAARPVTRICPAIPDSGAGESIVNTGGIIRTLLAANAPARTQRTAMAARTWRRCLARLVRKTSRARATSAALGTGGAQAAQMRSPCSVNRIAAPSMTWPHA